MSELTKQSIESTLILWNVPFSARYVGETKRADWQCDAWRVSIGGFETDYYTGLGQRKQTLPMPQPALHPRCIAYAEWKKTAFKPVAPAAADVLHSLLLDARAADQSFSDWCSDYGYDDDSLKALDTHRACCAIGKELRKVFAYDQIAQLETLLEDY